VSELEPPLSRNLRDFSGGLPRLQQARTLTPSVGSSVCHGGRRQPLSRVPSSLRSVCLRVSGAVAPSAPPATAIVGRGSLSRRCHLASGATLVQCGAVSTRRKPRSTVSSPGRVHSGAAESDTKKPTRRRRLSSISRFRSPVSQLSGRPVQSRQRPRIRRGEYPPESRRSGSAPWRNNRWACRGTRRR